MNDSWFRPYIEGLRLRPGMYLRIPTAAGLGTHVDGYVHARRCLGYDMSAEDLEFVRRFEEWLRVLSGSNANADWATLVDIVAGHAASMTEFNELWDRFHDEQGIDHVKGSIWGPDGGRSWLTGR
jgi:hypothetical protein